MIFQLKLRVFFFITFIPFHFSSIFSLNFRAISELYKEFGLCSPLIASENGIESSSCPLRPISPVH